MGWRSTRRCPIAVDIELAPDLGIERNLDAEEEVENITSSELELIAPEGLEETPDLSRTIWLWIFRNCRVTEESAEDQGLGLDLIDPDAPLTSSPHGRPSARGSWYGGAGRSGGNRFRG